MGITINLQYQGSLRCVSTHVKSGSTLTTDAPTDNHGLGSTFSPTDLTATSLVTCMITVMGIKATQEGIPFKNLTATCTKKMASNPRRIDALEVVIRVAHDWSTSQKTLMEKTAKECPVALSLHPDITQEVVFQYI